MKNSLASLALFLWLSCSSCVKDHNKYDPDAPMDFDGITDELNLCGREWGDLYYEWSVSVNPLDRTLKEVQEAILSRDDSTLSVFIRRVWEESSKAQEVAPTWGSWPIEEKMSEKFALIFHLESKAIVSEACSSPFWLASVLISEFSIDSEDNNGYYVPADAPTEIEWESHSLKHWYVFWLFHRHPDIGG